MSKFEESRWTDSAFSQNYRDEADIYLPFRQKFIEVTKSFYTHFINANIEIKLVKRTILVTIFLISNQ